MENVGDNLGVPPQTKYEMMPKKSVLSPVTVLVWLEVSKAGGLMLIR